MWFKRNCLPSHLELYCLEQGIFSGDKIQLNESNEHGPSSAKQG